MAIAPRLSGYLKGVLPKHGSNVITEEPGAVVPHAGICVGASG